MCEKFEKALRVVAEAENQGKDISQLFDERLLSMSKEERESYRERLLEISQLYGSGGP